MNKISIAELLVRDGKWKTIEGPTRKPPKVIIRNCTITHTPGYKGAIIYAIGDVEIHVYNCIMIGGSFQKENNGL